MKLQPSPLDFSKRPDLFFKVRGEWFMDDSRESEALDWIEAQQAKIRADAKELQEHRRLLRKDRERRARNVQK